MPSDEGAMIPLSLGRMPSVLYAGRGGACSSRHESHISNPTATNSRLPYVVILRLAEGSSVGLCPTDQEPLAVLEAKDVTAESGDSDSKK